jgi:hypothetical protein
MDEQYGGKAKNNHHPYGIYSKTKADLKCLIGHGIP